ncbi:MAG: hypothetical protein ABFD96_16035 [Armatimonadia bacterium]
MSVLREQLLTDMTVCVEQALDRYDDKTGRFLTQPDGPIAPGASPADLYWCPINQDILYALATLYVAEGSPYRGNDKLLKMACRAGDAIRSFQYPDGQVEFIKADGSKWGPTYMGWTNYAWLETYALLKDELGEKRRKDWEEGLKLAHEGQAKEIASGGVHNIMAWKAMSCYRAGQLFDRPDWQELATRAMQQVVATQRPGGYWPEHEGPTTLYNLVYVHALGLYFIFSLDESVLPALEASARFHETFTYPDGSVVETIDGRVKYHPNVSQFALVSFSLFPHGRRYVRYLLAVMKPERDCAGVQGGLLPSAYHHLVEGEEEAVPLDEASYSTNYHDMALVRREEPWFVCLSALATPAVGSRWGQDRQNCLSIWHRDCGLIIGGGNSKDQPEWSSFVAGGRFIPDQARVVPDGNGVAYAYGQVYTLLEIEVEPNWVTVVGQAEQGPAVHQLVLNLKKGQRLRTGAGFETVAGEDPIWWDSAKLGGWLQIDRVKIELPHGARLRWPVMPFNPYAIDGAPTNGSEMGVLAINLDSSSARWRISVVG